MSARTVIRTRPRGGPWFRSVGIRARSSLGDSDHSLTNYPTVVARRGKPGCQGGNSAEKVQDWTRVKTAPIQEDKKGGIQALKKVERRSDTLSDYIRTRRREGDALRSRTTHHSFTLGSRHE